MSDYSFIPSGKVMGDDSTNTPISTATDVTPGATMEAAIPEENVSSTEASPAAEPERLKRDKFCRNCGNPLGENDRFCENCGTPVVTVEVSPSYDEPTESPAAGGDWSQESTMGTAETDTIAGSTAAGWNQSAATEQAGPRTIVEPEEAWVHQSQTGQQTTQQAWQQTTQQTWQQDSKTVKGSSKKNIAIFFGVIIVIIVLAIVGIMFGAASARPSSGNPMTKAVYYEGGNVTIEDNLYIKAGTKTMVHFVPYKGDASTCSWYTDDTSVATIDSNGVLFTKKEGYVTVYCDFPNGVEQTMTVYVAD